jgi:hypothetical protein
LYDSVSNTMHSIFYGGMAQYSYVNNVLTQDVNVPFVKTISRVSRDANGNLLESVFPIEMPSFLGASSEFIPNNLLSHYENEVIKLSPLTVDSVLLGHIVGGIQSSQTNPFTNNTTASTNANTTIYEVWLYKNSTTGIHYLDGSNPLQISVFPNPSKKELHCNAILPYYGDLHLLITDVNGKLIEEQTFRGLGKGQHIIDLNQQLNLNEGLYTFNFVFDGKYTIIEKVIMSK